jgi:membrane-bound serine protease (ClpP class)
VKNTSILKYRGPAAITAMALAFIILLSSPKALSSAVQPVPVRPAVIAVKVDGPINPVSSEIIQKAIKDAGDRHCNAVVILLDTPGGLDTSMRAIIKAINASEVPVITYVSPGGARAASAGVFITLASHIAAMAPGTNIGAAHPVSMTGQQLDKTMSEKVENDAAAYIRSIADRHSRNAAWAEESVRKSVSVSENEALKLKVIDLVAANLDELLSEVDGRVVVTAVGNVTLATKGAKVENAEQGFRLKLLGVISDPNIAYILMMAGILGLFFELSNPGLVLPGVVGGISIVLAFYAFQTLPVNYAGILLIMLAILFFVAEIKITSYGLLSVAGVVSLALGSIMLFDSPLPFMRISLKLIMPVVAVLAAFMAILVRVAVRAHKTKALTGIAALTGRVGEAKTDIFTDGEIYADGAYWSAYADEPIGRGSRVRVIGNDGHRLKIEKVNG